MSKQLSRSCLGTSSDVLEFVLNSEIRLRILGALADASLEKRDLGDELGEPRSTVDQNIKRLEERDLIERTTDGYRCTWFGTTVQRIISQCVERIDNTRRHAEFFAHVPVERRALEALAAADATELPPTQLFLEFGQLGDRIRDSERIRVMTPYLVPRFLDGIFDWTDGGSLAVEIITCDPATEGLLDDDERSRSVAQSEAVSHIHCDAEIPLGLVLTDGVTLAIAFDDEGLPRSVLRLEDERAESWAEYYFEQWRGRAT